MPDSVQTHITELLAGAARGDDASEERLWQAVYTELRAMAGKQMAAESPGRTLQPTALVHEAYLRLTGGAPVKWENRRHFFAAAAKAMRRIRVDDARRRTRRKRGGDRATMSLPDNVGADGPDPGEMLDIDEALDRLEREFPREARVVMLRYFVGMTGEETAEALGVSPRRWIVIGDTRGLGCTARWVTNERRPHARSCPEGFRGRDRARSAGTQRLRGRGVCGQRRTSRRGRFAARARRPRG